MFEPERRAINQLLVVLRVEIVEKDPSVSGFNIGMNSGHAAGQTIDHYNVANFEFQMNRRKWHNWTNLNEPDHG